MHSNILALLILSAAPAATALPLLPENTFLVRGVVVGEKPFSWYILNEVRVEHVFHGQSDIVGQSFSANSLDGPRQSGNQYIIEPRLRIGEKGIWVVRWSNGSLGTVDWYNYMRWPVLEAGGPRWVPPYETIKPFTQAVERVSRLPGRNEAIGALERLAADANPFISSWAVARLPVVSEGSEEASDFLKALVADAHLPIQGQLALDRALLGEADMEGLLIERPSTGWQHSNARIGLFRRWFSGALSKRDAGLVITRLDRTAQHPDLIGFRQDDLMRLVTLLVKNEKLPLAERKRAGTIIMWAARTYDNDEEVFNIAVDLVSSDLPDELRAAIAAGFMHAFTLDDTRRQALQKLRDADNSKPVAPLLDKALARRNGDAPWPFGRAKKE